MSTMNNLHPTCRGKLPLSTLKYLKFTVFTMSSQITVHNLLTRIPYQGPLKYTTVFINLHIHEHFKDIPDICEL